MPTIVIGADLCPIEENQPYFVKGDAENLFHDLLPELQGADLTLANLECPLIESPSPILKTGPTFGEPPACLNGIKAGGFDLLCLANNHILDHGEAGLRSTLKACAAAGLETVGAGANLTEARRPFIRQLGSVRVAVIAMAEHEFSLATGNSWGANPLDPIEFVRTVRAYRAQFDYLVVLVHGSAEFHVPTPRLRQACRFFIEMGANAVLVQHPHCLGGTEDYLHGHIIYGQGALVMDEAIYRSMKTFHEGFLVKLHVADDATSRCELIPFRQSDPVPGARRMDPADEQRLRQHLADRARVLASDEAVEEDWRRFCLKREHYMISVVLGHGRIVRRLNRGGLIERLFYPRARLASVRNLVRCETHRETLETIFASRPK